MEQERRLESRAQNKHGLNEPTWCYPCLFTADLCLHPCVCVCVLPVAHLSTYMHCQSLLLGCDPEC